MLIGSACRLSITDRQPTYVGQVCVALLSCSLALTRMLWSLTLRRLTVATSLSMYQQKIVQERIHRCCVSQGETRLFCHYTLGYRQTDRQHVMAIAELALATFRWKCNVPCQIYANMQLWPISAYFCCIFHDYMVRIFLKKLPHKTDMPKNGEFAQWAFSVDQSIAWLYILSRVCDEIENGWGQVPLSQKAKTKDLDQSLV